MKFYVTSDIHGFFEEFIDALNKTDFDFNNPNHTLIICGDLFDRGHSSDKLINFLIEHKNKIILIRGNHEDLMQKMIYRNFPTYADKVNGTYQTLIDLNPKNIDVAYTFKEIATFSNLQTVLDLCQNYYETKHYIFVHGYIPIDEFNSAYRKDWRDASYEEWSYAFFKLPLLMYIRKIFEPGKTIVCGHQGTYEFWKYLHPDKYSLDGKNMKFDPFISKELIALDASTFLSKKVNFVILEDDEI